MSTPDEPTVSAETTAPPDAAPASSGGDARSDESESGRPAGPPTLEERVVAQLKTVYDPEIPVDIHALGLIYDVEVEGDHVRIRMTLTSPACPVAGSLPGEVEQKVEAVDGVESCEVELVWDPVWNPEMMSEEAKLELGFF